MLNKQNLIVFGLVTLLPIVVLMLLDPALLVFYFMPIPIFGAVVIVTSFLNKSNKFKFAIAVSASIVYPVFLYGYAYLEGFSGFH